ncbi:MFS transporter [Bosea sp. (in: a-proteobacteria)]|uniref:MFS transporter n=1 Tax=Bosea sp. (in: a-proteobacteria) TaxID=1871050 RepID=UPI002FC70AA8
MTGKTKAESGSVAALGAIVTGALVLQVASTIMHTVVPLRMALESQPLLLIGLVGSAYSVGFLLGCFAIPRLIRRVGHIRGFAVFASLQAALTLSFPLVPVEWWSLSRFVMGAAAAGHSICIESWISGQASSSHRGRIFGLYQILNRLALIGSQVGIGYVAIQTQDVFLIASAAFSIALIPVSLTRASGPASAELVSVKLNTLWLQAPAAVVGCLYVGLMSGPLTNVAPAYGILIGLGQQPAILLTAAIQVGALLLQWPMGWLADRVDSRRVLLAAAAGTALTSAVLGALFLSGTPQRGWWLYGLFALIGGGSVPLYTVAVTHAYFRLGREQAVGLSAGLLFLWSVGATIGPLVATAVMQIVGPQGLLIYTGALSATVAAYFGMRILKSPIAAEAAAVREPATTSLPDLGPRPRQDQP